MDISQIRLNEFSFSRKGDVSTLKEQIQLTFGIGILIVTILVMLAWSYVRQQEWEAFEMEGGRIKDLITENMNACHLLPKSLQALFLASGQVNAEQFRIFAGQAFSNNLSIFSISYHPRVLSGQRGVLADGYHQWGVPAFEIFELDNKLPRPVTKRNCYFPLVFVEPITPDSASLVGYDILSDQRYATAIQKAIESGLPAYSYPSRLSDGSNEYMIFIAVYDGNNIPEALSEKERKASGIVALTVRLRPFLEKHLSSSHIFARIGMFFDEDGPYLPRMLDVFPEKDAFASRNSISELSKNYQIEIGAQRFRIWLTRPLDIFNLNLKPIFLAIFIGLSAVMGFFLLLQAIEKRKRAEKELLDHLAFTETLLSAAPTPIFYKDTEGYYQGCNKAFTELIGLPLEEIKGKTARELFQGKLSESDQELELELIRQQDKKVYERRLAGWYGKNRHVIIGKAGFDHADGTPAGVVGFIIDITDRKQVEKALRDSHERFLTVLNGIDAYVFVADMQTNEILLMNKHMADGIGQDVSGKACWMIFGNIPAPCGATVNERLFDTDGNPIEVCVWESEDPVAGKWYLNYMRPIKWGDGRYVRLQTSTDITRVKKLEQERIEMERQLRQAQKMESIGTLAGGIAHDFNNILSAIIGYTELALIEIPEDSDPYKKLNAVLDASERAKNLVMQILTFSRQNEQALQPCQIASIVKETVKLLRATIPTSIEIKQHIDAGSAMVSADPTQIHQLIMNLTTNAYQAMEETGGMINIRLTVVDLKAEDISDELGIMPGSYLLLTIRDNGPGIKPEVKCRIFEPYFTTKQQNRGTGLGLSVVHGIVKRHGGDLRCESEPGRGTVFDVYLPRIDHESGELKKDSCEPIPRGFEHVLLIDDEALLVSMETQMLESLGYRVTGKTDSKEALTLFRADPHAFDAVITDMTMPCMTGDRLAREMLHIRSDIPIILCTGYSDNISEEKIQQAGIRQLLMKPVSQRKIAEVLRKVVAKSTSQIGDDVMIM